ncbi:hypothetical protein PG990_006298 [Apiospora arundinis]|uniref:Uncharacterized protein n=1 Tax=Apiospora arundinis TaxID=335852 RepID=A0ABR2JA15_9PEZI
MDSYGQGSSGEEPRYSSMVPEFNAEWVDSTMKDVVKIVKNKPPTERAAYIRVFLRADFPGLREVIVAQWEVGDGSFWSGETDTHSQQVFDALKRADAWRDIFTAKVKADERGAAANGRAQPGQNTNHDGKSEKSEQRPSEASSGRSGDIDKKLSAKVPTPDAVQLSLLQERTVLPVVHGPASGTSNVPAKRPSNA